jgi:hypothetical protein
MVNKIELNQIVDNTDTTNFRQVDYAKLFIWFLTDIKGNDDCQMPDIVRCFRDTNLSIPNQTILRRNLRKLKDVTVGHSYKSFRLHRDAIKKFREAYSKLITQPISSEEIIRQRLDVSKTPCLSSSAIDEAYVMGQVYVAIHCLENSVRNLIRKVLKSAFGENWWEKASSDPMKKRVAERKIRETKNKWLTPRGADELNYLDWADLVTLMRKYPDHFNQFIGSIKFAELKLEELENLRHIAFFGVNRPPFRSKPAGLSE